LPGWVKRQNRAEKLARQGFDSGRKCILADIETGEEIRRGALSAAAMDGTVRQGERGLYGTPASGSVRMGGPWVCRFGRPGLTRESGFPHNWIMTVENFKIAYDLARER